MNLHFFPNGHGPLWPSRLKWKWHRGIKAGFDGAFGASSPVDIGSVRECAGLLADELRPFLLSLAFELLPLLDLEVSEPFDLVGLRPPREPNACCTAFSLNSVSTGPVTHSSMLRPLR